MGLFENNPHINEDCIYGFDGPNRFLSNFWMHPFTIDGWRWPSSEHAYQAAKSLDQDEWRMIQRLAHPAHAKRMGLRLKLRSDWVQIRIDAMTYIIDHKFNVPELAERLLNTGNLKLVEANNWNDTFWGVSIKTNQGQNNLGQILMNKRENLKLNS